MDEVGNEYIERTLIELMPTIGVKEPIEHLELVTLIEEGKISLAIKKIAICLGLPISIDLNYVSKDYNPGQQGGFTSKHLVKMNNQSSGSSGITAQVEIPANLPFYGALKLIDFPVKVKINRDSIGNPETFITIIAHELSHILLYSMQHFQKENEFYTDLTAMALGFRNVMEKGRKVVKTEERKERNYNTTNIITTTQTVNYGYLSDSNFDFAKDLINRYIKEQKTFVTGLERRTLKIKADYGKAKNTLFLFERYLVLIDSHHAKKIKLKDSEKIILFHNPEYLDSYRGMLSRAHISMQKSLRNLEQLRIFKKDAMEDVERAIKTAEDDSAKLLERRKELFEDVKLLKRNISLIHRFKVAKS